DELPADGDGDAGGVGGGVRVQRRGGADGGGRVGEQQHGDAGQRGDVDDGGPIRQRAGVQRRGVRDGAERHVTPAHERDNAGGVGEPDDGEQRVAGRDLQGQRQLLPV